MEKIKLVWEFRGSEAEKTAEHHAIHLREYNQLHSRTDHECGTEKISDLYVIAYMIVPRDEMLHYRDHLKPQRAFVLE